MGYWDATIRPSPIDVDDLVPGDHAIILEHRPETGTKLKNGKDGERWIYLSPHWYQIVEDSLNHPDRHDIVDGYGRKPLLTTSHGHPTGDTISTRVNRATQPCEYGGCSHDIDPEECEARGRDGYPSKCPSSVGPHAVRRGAIAHHLNKNAAPEAVSERCDVSLEVLYKHYDVRTGREKMDVRRCSLGDML